MKTVAIIPALNENKHLPSVIEGSLKYVDQVVIIDDGSRIPLHDALPINSRVHILRHIINLGKGAALKTGVVWATQQGFDTAIFIDADGQHDPNEIPSLLKPIEERRAAIVFGIRKFHGRMPLVARLGNIFLTKAMQLLFRIQVEDTQSGYRALSLSAFDKINWLSARYSVETEMIVNAGKHKVPFSQVPVATIYHDNYKGTTIIDGIRIIINMLAWRIL